MVAERVVELGAGILLDKNQITPALLRQTLAKILSDDSYRKSSRIIGESLQAAGCYSKAADEIFQLKERLFAGVTP